MICLGIGGTLIFGPHWSRSGNAHLPARDADVIRGPPAALGFQVCPTPTEQCHVEVSRPGESHLPPTQVPRPQCRNGQVPHLAQDMEPRVWCKLGIFRFSHAKKRRAKFLFPPECLRASKASKHGRWVCKKQTFGQLIWKAETAGQPLWASCPCVVVTTAGLLSPHRPQLNSDPWAGSPLQSCTVPYCKTTISGLTKRCEPRSAGSSPSGGHPVATLPWPGMIPPP